MCFLRLACAMFSSSGSWQEPGEDGACYNQEVARGLAKHGDNAVEDGYGDDEDANERLVCVLHYKSIFKGRE
jgi:hypothetical protein